MVSVGLRRVRHALTWHIPCRKQLSRLFELAGESSTAVQGLARSPDKFWKSAHTKSVIAQEEALKHHLFAQMFDAGASPA